MFFDLAYLRAVDIASATLAALAARARAYFLTAARFIPSLGNIVNDLSVYTCVGVNLLNSVDSSVVAMFFV